MVGGDDVVAQARQVFAIMERVLAAAGATPADVVKVTVYLLDIDDRPLINPVRQEFFGSTRPASTLVEVSRLAVPGARLEIEADRAPAPVNATEIAARVAAGELSAEEVVADALARIAARPELNAVITRLRGAGAGPGARRRAAAPWPACRCSSRTSSTPRACGRPTAPRSTPTTSPSAARRR